MLFPMRRRRRVSGWIVASFIGLGICGFMIRRNSRLMHYVDALLYECKCWLGMEEEQME